MNTWKTLDGRIIPIKDMTTTHISNAMFYLYKNRYDNYQPLLDEWLIREKEGLWRKVKRHVRRTWHNWYKNTPKNLQSPYKPSFEQLHRDFDPLDINEEPF